LVIGEKARYKKCLSAIDRYKRIILFVLAILVLNSFISITTGFNLVEKSVKRVLESTGIYTEQRKKIELKSKDWDAKTGGAWKIDKSVEWTSSNTVKATIAIDTMVASENQKKDILFVLDVFGSYNSSVDLTEVKAATQDLTNYVLENDSNRVAYITSDNVNETIIADVFESVLGAIYLDLGFEKAKEYCNKIILPYIKGNYHFFSDYKSALQEMVQTDKESLTKLPT